MDNHQIGNHISEEFNKELADVRHQVLTMGSLVKQQLELAMSAFSAGDSKLAEQDIKLINQVNELRKSIDQQCMQILALRQPTAFDLRFLITVIKMIYELDMMGELTGSIAKMTIRISSNVNKHDTYPELEHLSQSVQAILHTAITDFAKINIINRTTMADLDENLTREYTHISRELNLRMMQEPQNITRTLDILWSARVLERIGDHAFHICEELIYMLHGEKVKRSSPTGAY